MAEYDLTLKQRQLLRTITEQLEAGTGKEPMFPVSDTLIGIKGKFDRNLLGDLEILSEAGLLGSRFNSSGQKMYSVKQSGYDAVKNNFVVPEGSPNTQQTFNIGAIIRDVNGGTIQAVGFNSHAELTQIINDPGLLKEKVDTLADQLLDNIKSELPSKQLVSYIQSLDELKKQIKSEKPSPSILQRLFTNISFMGDIEGAISLATRVWPYVYPLLIIAAQKIGSGG
jgi:hypothetical protein